MKKAIIIIVLFIIAGLLVTAENEEKEYEDWCSSLEETVNKLDIASAHMGLIGSRPEWHKPPDIPKIRQDISLARDKILSKEGYEILYQATKEVNEAVEFYGLKYSYFSPSESGVKEKLKEKIKILKEKAGGEI